VQISNVDQYIYDSSRPKFAQRYGGLIDAVTGACWLSTVDGVRELKYNDWIIESEDGLRVMPREEVLAKFQPLDWDEAFNMLGSTNWPGRPHDDKACICRHPGARPWLR
jgi:hypothetical protein